MNAIVQNVDDQAFGALRARAAQEGRTVGELLSDAIKAYLITVQQAGRKGSLRALTPEPYPEGNDHLSSEADAVVYGVQR